MVCRDAQGGVEQVLRAILRVPLPIASRDTLYKALAEHKGVSRETALWLGSGLHPLQGSSSFTWGFDRDAAVELYRDYCRRDYWADVTESASTSDPHAHEVHVVRGGRSDRFQPEDVERLGGLGRRAHVVPRAGHWLLAEDPRAVLESFVGAMKRL